MIPPTSSTCASQMLHCRDVLVDISGKSLLYFLKMLLWCRINRQTFVKEYWSRAPIILTLLYWRWRRPKSFLNSYSCESVPVMMMLLLSSLAFFFQFRSRLPWFFRRFNPHFLLWICIWWWLFWIFWRHCYTQLEITK